MKILGECSICGGNVIMPTIWHGIYPPTPTCSTCSAVAEIRPTIKMKKQIFKIDASTNTGTNSSEKIP